MYHSFINRRRIDWWKNIWYTSISDWCITEMLLDWQIRHLGEIGIYQKMAGIVQDGHHSNSVQIHSQSVGSQRWLSCQLAQRQSVDHQLLDISGNFQNFFIPPLDLWKPPILLPDLQFSLDWQDFEGSDRLLHGIWENDFNLDVSLKWVMLHQAKLKFPGKLAISNTKKCKSSNWRFSLFFGFFLRNTVRKVLITTFLAQKWRFWVLT